MQEQRAFWTQLPGGQRVRMLRPVESDLYRHAHGVTVDAVCTAACGWEGFSEATLLGAAIGASDPLPFDAALWSAYVRDNVAAAKVCVNALAEAISQHLLSQDETAKN